MQLQTDLTGITPAQLAGFFEGWPSPPTPETLRRVLEGASHVALAVQNGQVVGLAYAVSDGVLAAYIPLLEVRAEWRGRGVATRLMRALLAELDGLYMVDTACDDELVPFYERLGFGRGNAMIRRDYARQGGRGVV